MFGKSESKEVRLEITSRAWNRKIIRMYIERQAIESKGSID